MGINNIFGHSAQYNQGFGDALGAGPLVFSADGSGDFASIQEAVKIDARSGSVSNGTEATLSTHTFQRGDFAVDDAVYIIAAINQNAGMSVARIGWQITGTDITTQGVVKLPSTGAATFGMVRTWLWPKLGDTSNVGYRMHWADETTSRSESNSVAVNKADWFTDRWTLNLRGNSEVAKILNWRWWVYKYKG